MHVGDLRGDGINDCICWSLWVRDRGSGMRFAAACRLQGTHVRDKVGEGEDHLLARSRLSPNVYASALRVLCFAVDRAGQVSQPSNWRSSFTICKSYGFVFTKSSFDSSLLERFLTLFDAKDDRRERDRLVAPQQPSPLSALHLANAKAAGFA